MITSDPTVIENAVDVGINYFDTARGYQNGNNERMVGAALGRRRKAVHLSSKSKERNKQGALAELETSLRELGTDYLDIWYLHSMKSPDELTDEMCDTLDQAKKDGKIRFGGVSLHSNHQQLIPVLTKNPHIDVILLSYNFTMEPAIDPLIDAAAAAGKGVVAMKVMAGGFRRVKPGDPLYDKMNVEGTLLAALKWAIRKEQVHTSIPSITDFAQLEENLQAMSGPFGEVEEKLLQTQMEHIRPLYCRMCGSCDGQCPKHLPVADILRYLAYAEGYGHFYLGREKFQVLPKNLLEVRCSDCDHCPVQCPNGVQVAARLTRAQEVFA
jgi:predicted aldo/keto reductase-like oxidoreductase